MRNSQEGVGVLDRPAAAGGRAVRRQERASDRAQELFAQHGADVERVCRALLRDANEAEDATQQTFLAAYRALLGGTEPRDPGAWLATIARHECFHRVDARRSAAVPTPELDEVTHFGDVHGRAVVNLHAERLRREIRRLPAPQRDAIVLREYAGLSYEEVARELGVSRLAAHSLLVRGRATLRMRLRPEFAVVNLPGLYAAIRSGVGYLGWRAGALPTATKVAALTLSGGALVGGGVVAERAQTGPSSSRDSATTAVVEFPPGPITTLLVATAGSAVPAPTAKPRAQRTRASAPFLVPATAQTGSAPAASGPASASAPAGRTGGADAKHATPAGRPERGWSETSAGGDPNAAPATPVAEPGQTAAPAAADAGTDQDATPAAVPTSESATSQQQQQRPTGQPAGGGTATAPAPPAGSSTAPATTPPGQPKEPEGPPPGLVKKQVGTAPGLAKKPDGPPPGKAQKPGTPPGLAKKPNGLPPGLANTPDGLPPGQAKKADAGAPGLAKGQDGLPPGQAKRADAEGQDGTAPGQAKKAASVDGSTPAASAQTAAAPGPSEDQATGQVNGNGKATGQANADATGEAQGLGAGNSNAGGNGNGNGNGNGGQGQPAAVPQGQGPGNSNAGGNGNGNGQANGSTGGTGNGNGQANGVGNGNGNGRGGQTPTDPTTP